MVSFEVAVMVVLTAEREVAMMVDMKAGALGDHRAVLLGSWLAASWACFEAIVMAVMRDIYLELLSDNHRAVAMDNCSDIPLVDEMALTKAADLGFEMAKTSAQTMAAMSAILSAGL